MGTRENPTHMANQMVEPGRMSYRLTRRLKAPLHSVTIRPTVRTAIPVAHNWAANGRVPCKTSPSPHAALRTPRVIKCGHR